MLTQGHIHGTLNEEWNHYQWLTKLTCEWLYYSKWYSSTFNITSCLLLIDILYLRRIATNLFEERCNSSFVAHHAKIILLEIIKQNGIILWKIHFIFSKCTNVACLQFENTFFQQFFFFVCFLWYFILKFCFRYSRTSPS